MMKFVVIVVIIVSVCSGALSQEASLPRPEGSFSAYYGPGQAFKLTITSENGVVSVLEVPKGVFLNVVASVAENPSFKDSIDFPREVRGDITLRTRRKDEIEGGGVGMAAHEFLSSSPMVVSLTNVAVLLELVD